MAELVTIRADVAQVERLLALGVLSPAQAEAGRRAGGLVVSLPAHLVDQWQAQARQIEELADYLYRTGLSRPARLFLGAGRPLSFVGSQLLLVVQPLSQIVFGRHDQAGRYSQLLEDRTNVDRLLARLDQLEQVQP